MSGYTISPPFTVAAPPTTAEVALSILSSMQAQSGVLTDYNPGSIIRTFSEATGSVVEIEAVSAQALAFQAMVYGTWGAFGITPLQATYATTTEVFSTASGSPATQDVFIGQGTIVSTVGNVQYTTTANAILLSGTSSVSVPIMAINSGNQGNTGANTINVLSSSLSYPLTVTNPTAATGGTPAETPGQTMGRFMAKVASLGLASPVAIANAAIGISVSGTSERVIAATVVEPWITSSGAGAYFDLYIDNGTGGASSTLIQQVTTTMNGVFNTDNLGFRPAGVPYSVLAVVPVYCTVTVTGVVFSSSLITVMQTNVTNALASYFQGLQFGQSVSLVNLIAIVANTVSSSVSSLNVILYNSSGTSVQTISADDTQRIILTSSNVTFTS